ncbi:MAG: sigma 54-interacting transcriptional regulator [Desulfomonilaceae bacterium]|nr:sigma 54-interacting transcriptional regulator [Desulfomonilaceae bacterium]
MVHRPIEILLLENDDAHAEAVRRAFQGLGGVFHLSTAATLREALDLLDRFSPDLVIADLVLPDGTGLDVLPPDMENCAFPLLLMTNQGGEHVTVDSNKAGVLDYVVKSPEIFQAIPLIAQQVLCEWNQLRIRNGTDRQIRESEEKLRLALESAGEGMWEWDWNTGTVHFDQSALKILGVSWEEPEIAFDSWIARIHPEDLPAAARVLRDYLDGWTERYSVEFRWPTMRGEWRWLVSHGKVIKYASDGKPLIMMGVLRDISETKRAEEALRMSEQRFRAIFEGAPEAVFIKDRDLKYIQVNPALCELLGLHPSEIIGKKASAIYGKDAGDRIQESHSRALAGERIEIEQIRPVQGTLMTFLDTIVPLRDSKNEIVGICGISRDITTRTRLAKGYHVSSDLSHSRAMRAAMETARVAARTDCIVLLHGESGSGKDYLARWIHDNSRRAGGPFFAVNCAAIARDLAESELFGHERGAFTGATGRKKGILELAEGGTILLNEIGELEPSLQAKLLAFLDTQSFLRVGGEQEVQIDARLIAATHRNLEREVAEGRFLKPLFYRLSVFPLHVPPLRERTQDIPRLAEALIADLAKEMQLTEIPVVKPRHIAALSQYSWPGNVREMRNVLERSLILWKGGEFEPAMPSPPVEDQDWSHTVRYVPGRTVRDATNEVKSFLCAAAMEVCEGNKTDAAKLLGVSRDAFYRYIRLMRKYPKIKTRE